MSTGLSGSLPLSHAGGLGQAAARRTGLEAPVLGERASTISSQAPGTS